METIGETYARLRSAQKKRARGAPAYSVFVNRPVGRVLAAFAFRIGLSPNQVTLVSAVFTFAGIALIALAPAVPVIAVVIWLLLAVGYAWDSADGQVARLRGGGSLSGEWLDHFVDAVKISALHLAVLVGASDWTGLPRVWLLVPIGFTVVANATFFGMILNDLLKQKRGIPTSAQVGGGGPLRSILLLPTDYGILCLSFVLWAWMLGFAIVYTAIFICSTLFLIAAAAKWFRDMRRVDRDAASA